MQSGRSIPLKVAAREIRHFIAPLVRRVCPGELLGGQSTRSQTLGVNRIVALARNVQRDYKHGYLRERKWRILLHLRFRRRPIGEGSPSLGLIKSHLSVSVKAICAGQDPSRYHNYFRRNFSWAPN